MCLIVLFLGKFYNNGGQSSYIFLQATNFGKQLDPGLLFKKYLTICLIISSIRG